MILTEHYIEAGAMPVAKKPERSVPATFNIKFDEDDADELAIRNRLHVIAQAYGINITSLIRMMIREGLPLHEKRVGDLRKANHPE